jgi:hypothetical protein
MNRSLWLLLAACGVGSAELVSVPSDTSETSSSQDELAVGQCFGQNGGIADFLDGGVQRLQACLADAGIPVTIPPIPSFDAGIPPLPSFDAGIPPLPSFDAGLPPLPAFDAGVPGVPPGLLSKCSAGCTCPSGLTCLNPLQQTCPGTLTLCIP